MKHTQMAQAVLTASALALLGGAAVSAAVAAWLSSEGRYFIAVGPVFCGSFLTQASWLLIRAAGALGGSDR